jgi:hypothetical protein
MTFEKYSRVKTEQQGGSDKSGVLLFISLKA